MQRRPQHRGIAKAECGIEMALGRGTGTAHPVHAPVAAELRRAAITTTGTEHDLGAVRLGAAEDGADAVEPGVGMLRFEVREQGGPQFQVEVIAEIALRQLAVLQAHALLSVFGFIPWASRRDAMPVRALLTSLPRGSAHPPRRSRSC